MRQGQNSKRSRGRGSGRRNVPPRHQTFDSNGPSIRIRGNAFQVHEKYLALARDAAGAGDRIAAENYLQHAEHYFRIINADTDGDSRGRERQNGAGRRGMDFGNGFDQDFDDEAAEARVEVAGSAAATEAPPARPNGSGEQPDIGDQPEAGSQAGSGETAGTSAVVDTAPQPDEAPRRRVGRGRGRPPRSPAARKTDGDAASDGDDAGPAGES